jgi:uncharacterized membrane protein YdjX (TVP38/TMEM64 family)
MSFARLRSRQPLRRWTIAAGLLGIIILGLMGSWVAPHRVLGAVQGLMEALRGLGYRGAVVFAVLQMLVAVSGVLPASLLGVAAGAIYGFVPGFLLAAAGTLVGAILSFMLSRSLFRPTIERLSARRPRLRNLDALVDQAGWQLVCLLRLSPIMPFSATSLALGLSRIGLRSYALGTLASLPALAGYVFTGTLADSSLAIFAAGASPVHWGLLGLGIIATGAVTVRLGQILIKLGIVPSSMSHFNIAGREEQTVVAVVNRPHDG